MSEPAKLLRYIEEITVMQSRHFFGRLRPAPEFRGPKADSGIDQIGSAPAPDKKKGSSKQLRLRALKFHIYTLNSLGHNFFIN